MKVFALLFIVAATVASPNQRNVFNLDQAEAHFDDFVKAYDRQYPTEAEKQKRFEIFKENLRSINEKSLRSSNSALGITQFSDLTNEEFINLHTCYHGNKADALCAPGANNSFHAPAAFDWRDKGVISPPKNQQTCGSCWAFSAIGNIEAQHAIKHSEMLDLSEQQLVDCDRRSDGCHGTYDLGYPFMYLTECPGSEQEQDYSYEDRQYKCRFDQSKVKVKVSGCVRHTPQTEDEVADILANVGPLTIGVDATDMQFYTGNILEKCSCTQPNHAVLLVGYGTENGTPFWVIKNSWGQGYGENGFIRIRRGVDACGMMYLPMIHGVVA